MDDDLKTGITMSLEEWKAIDGLVVVVEAEYLIAKGRFQYWQMVNPTKNFDITITYPEHYQLQFKTLVLEDVVSQITEGPGYLKFGYSSWALPQSGLAWLIAAQPPAVLSR
ncbi:hypothetical protein KAF44_28265 (plasmid) [Cupriavidus necator]|nr:hypothetical protein KAF44_28265 [Cupriavidus necator]